MPGGLFVYNPEGHLLKQIFSLDLRKQLSAAASGLGPIEDATCDIVITVLAVERDGRIITANDSSVAVQFARAIVAALKGNLPKPNKTPTK